MRTRGTREGASSRHKDILRIRQSPSRTPLPWGGLPATVVVLQPSPRGMDAPSPAKAHRPYAGGMNSYLTDQRDRPVSAFVAVVVALLTGGYMLPWAVAALRGKSNHWTIFWINLLGGWTVILWIVALVMSFGSHKTISRY